MNTDRTAIFVSYSHRDNKWLERLLVHLKPLERKGLIHRWDDTKIETGDLWRVEIREAIDKAKIAILLVSADFLASDFIVEDELPPLLRMANEDGLSILPIIVSPCAFTRTASLKDYQAANDPSKPLVMLQIHEQEQILDNLSSRIERIIRTPHEELYAHLMNQRVILSRVKKLICLDLICLYSTCLMDHFSNSSIMVIKRWKSNRSS